MQDDQNSLLLLIIDPYGLYIIKYFSVRQSRQMLGTELNIEAFANGLNLIEYCIFLSELPDTHVAVLLALVSVLKFAL